MMQEKTAQSVSNQEKTAQSVSNQKKFVLSDESAQEQLDLLLRYYDIEIADIGLQKSGIIDSVLSRIIRSIRQGNLTIALKSGKLSLLQTLVNPPGDVTELEYSEVTGQAKLVMDSAGAQSDHARMYALIGYLTGVGSAGIAKLSRVDLSLAEALGFIFLIF